MTQMTLGAAVTNCPSDCPFCKTGQLLGYTTKHGDLKKEKTLAKNLASDAAVITDSVGTLYPLPGAGDKTIGWEAKPGVLEDFGVKMAAAPHHIIPGKAAMKPSRLEQWTCANKGGKIKEDIGYNIDGAQNGIFLPHLPEIYFTRHKQGVPMSKFYGQTWAGLSLSTKQSISFTVMGETSLQLHYTNHNDPYVHMNSTINYDEECKTRCNQLADKMDLHDLQAQCKDNNGKLDPPYELVDEINLKSLEMKGRITGHPKAWV